jgi:hypothetical protein
MGSRHKVIGLQAKAVAPPVVGNAGVPVKNLKARMTVVCCTSVGSFVVEGKGVMAFRQVSSSFLACSA